MKIETLVANLHDKTEYCIHIRNLNHGLVLKRILRVIRFNQKSWIELYIAMNIHVRIAAKNNFEIDFSKLINNAVFGKTN